MKRNFFLRSEIEIECGVEKFDLHNDFYCTLIRFSPADGSISLVWRGVRSDIQLTLEFEQVSFLSLAGFDSGMPRKDDKVLSFAGFLHPEDQSIMDGFLTEEMSHDGYHMIISFEGGMTVKLLSESATLVVGK